MYSAKIRLISTISLIGLLVACEEERPPRSTTEFLENPIMLEAAIVRCSQDRTATRYDAECVNARQAVRTIEAEKEAARRAELEARSENKRQALRRTQEAAAQARRRAAESERQRREAEYLAQFGVALPPDQSVPGEDPGPGNTPQAVIPENTAPEILTSGAGDVVRASDGGNAPVSVAEPEDETQTDLQDIRDELQRRNDEDGGD